MNSVLVARHGLRAVAVIALAAVLAGCGASAPASSGGASDPSFRNDFLTFRHPVAWRPVVPAATGELHFDPMVYVSTQSLHAPCRKQSGATVCGWPLRRLDPGGVLIVWENRGYPGWSLGAVQGSSVRVGGRAAKRAVARPGSCAAIGADETVQIAIARPLPDNWTAFTACVRAPGVAAAERRIDALLASTHFLAK